MKFDRLHKLEDESDIDYFEPMVISVEDKNRRRELADLLTDVFLYFFSVYEVHLMHNSMLQKALYEQLLTDKISDAVSKVTGIDAEMSNHIRTLSREVVDTTFKHVNANDENVGRLNLHNPEDAPTALQYSPEEPSVSPNLQHITDGSHISEPLIDDESDENEVEEIMEDEATDEYWLSIRRAVNIAQDESNTFLNYTDFVNAKERGYTYKTWLTMLDNKVRETHKELEGKRVLIDEAFVIGDSEMRFPHDWESSPNPREVIGCRCSVEYS